MENIDSFELKGGTSDKQLYISYNTNYNIEFYKLKEFLDSYEFEDSDMSAEEKNKVMEDLLRPKNDYLDKIWNESNEKEKWRTNLFYVEKQDDEFILKYKYIDPETKNRIYKSSEKRIPLSSPEDQINGHINTIENIQLSGSGTITNSLTYSAAPIDNNYMEYCLNNEELGKHCIRVGPGIIEFPKAGRDGLKLQLTDGTKGSGTDSDFNNYSPYQFQNAELKFPNFGFQLTPLQKR